MTEQNKKSDWGVLDPESFGGEDYPTFTSADGLFPIWKRKIDTFPPLASPEQEEAIKNIGKKIDPGPWIQTYSGKKFYPLNPKEEDICLEDIARALSMQCRFTGHTKFHYSISQHSVLVSYLCDEKDQMHALLHDASEAYISDFSSPLKRLPEFKEYREIENNLQKIIYNKFELNEIEPLSVKKADQLLMVIEAKTLLPSIHSDWKFSVKPPPISVLSITPEEAEKLFLDRFQEIIKNK